MLNKINDLCIEIELLRKELDVAPDRKEFIEHKIKELEIELAALDQAWFFEDVDE